MRITAKYLKSVYDDGTYGIRDVNLDIPDGQFAVVVGASGCGKSTLLKVLAGLCKQTAGELYFDGLSAAKIPPKDRHMSMVFQEYLLYPKYTVWENLSLALERENLPREEEERRIREALAMFGVQNLAGQLPRVLSGGQQQRVALAKAAVTRPQAILFDEPLANVAEPNRIEYADNIKLLKKNLPDTTFVYVTHKLSEALQLADVLIVMKDGVVLQYGDVDFVTHNPYSKQVLDVLTDEPLRCDGDKVYNPYAACWQSFDDGGVVGGMKRTEFLSGNFDGKTLHVGNDEVADENIALRFAGNFGAVKVAVPTNKFHAKPCDGDIAVEGLIDVNKTDNATLTDIKRTLSVPLTAFDRHGTTYFSVADVDLYDTDGKLVTAHYRLYNAIATGRVSFGKLRLPCGAVDYKGTAKGRVTVSVDKLAKATTSKQGFVVEKCLDEQVWNDYKLCYCALRGFDRYVSLLLPKQTNLFVGKHRVTIEPEYWHVN